MDAIRLLATLLGVTILAHNMHAQSSSELRTSARTTVPVPTRLTRQPDFGIPFQLAAGAAEAAEVRLYVSADQGRDWKLYQRQPTSSQGFQFAAREDGEFWFAVRTADQRGQLISHQRWQPELKVIVDTQLPRVDLRVNVDAAGHALAEWILQDPSLAAHTFLLQYQDQNGNWQNVDVRTPAEGDLRQTWEGRTEWWLQWRAREAIIRAEVRDRAGNSALVHKRVSLAGISNEPAKPRFDNTANRAVGPVGSQQRQQPANPAATNWSDVNNGFRENLPKLPSWLSSVEHTKDAFGAAKTQHTANRSPPARTAPLWDPSGSEPTQSLVNGPVANRYSQGVRESVQQANQPRITSSPNFELEYDVYDVGQKGAKTIELWYTRDRGATWELYGADADHRSPMEVQLSNEGLYGFRLAVHGFDSKPAPAPENGAPADIWVGVDWTKPAGRITRATFIPDRQPESLLIEWTAEDALLAEQPITLSYSESTDGPWTPLATNLRNSGSYRWQSSQQKPIPGRIYLRMEIRDLAGNVTTTAYEPVVSAQGSIPSGRIRDVRPLRRTTQRPYTFR